MLEPDVEPQNKWKGQDGAGNPQNAMDPDRKARLGVEKPRTNKGEASGEAEKDEMPNSKPKDRESEGNGCRN